MAEVLITLAIIGVVAALTIPTVVAKYQKKQYYTQFMKSYNTLQTALDNSIVGNGPVWEWSDLSDQLDLPNSDISDKYFAPYLKVSKICDGDNLAGCFPSSMTTIGGGMEMSSSAMISSGDKIYVLSDGSAICLISHSMKPWNPKSGETSVDFIVDINGAKEPNVIGRDIFILTVRGSNDTNISQRELKLSSIQGIVEYTSDNSDENYGYCNPEETNSIGFSCADRLLKEGKMDY